MMDEYKIECLEDHQFKIGDEELPIELIYKLLDKNEIPVDKLFLSNVTDEYLRIVHEADETGSYSLDKMCDFAKFAARLLYLKLLRIFATTEEQMVEVETQEQDIIDRVNEYVLFQQISLKLRSTESVGMLFREPQFTEEDRMYVVNNLTLDMITTAYAHVLHSIELGPKTSKMSVKTLTKDKHSVKDKVSFIVDTLGVRKKMYFDELYHKKGNSKEEIITTFLAMLELVKIHFTTATQEDDGRIRLTMIDGIDVELFRNAKTENYEANEANEAEETPKKEDEDE